MSLDGKKCRDCGKVIHASSPGGKLEWFMVCPHCGAHDPYRPKHALIGLTFGIVAVMLLLWFLH